MYTPSLGTRLGQGSIALVAALVLFGAGCRIPSLPGSGSSSSSMGGSLEATTTRLIFAPGDSFEIDQTFLGFGGIITQLSRLTEGSRTLTITRFIPQLKADASFETVVERETDASRRARADAEAIRLRGSATGTPKALPEPVVERVVTTGTLMGIDLKSAHELYIPAYWKTGENDLVLEKSGLWLSQDAFLELSRTQKTVLDLGFFQQAATRLLMNVSDLRNALNRLKQEATTQEKTKDPLLLEVDPDTTSHAIVVNGKEIRVPVIKAHNWFGEVLVLNHPQNPLILKLSFNPLTAAAAEIMGKDKGLKTLFGYEINNLHVAAY